MHGRGQEVGFLPPAVHVRDNLELKPSAYRITLRGVMVGEGEAFPGMFLAINPGGISTPLIGTQTRSEEHTSELQSQSNLVCRLLLEKKNNQVCPTQ